MESPLINLVEKFYLMQVLIDEKSIINCFNFTYSFKHLFIYLDFSLGSKYNIQEILIENCLILKPKNVKNKLSYLYKKNLFMLNTKNIEVKLREIEFFKF